MIEEMVVFQEGNSVEASFGPRVDQNVFHRCLFAEICLAKAGPYYFEELVRLALVNLSIKIWNYKTIDEGDDFLCEDLET